MNQLDEYDPINNTPPPSDTPWARWYRAHRAAGFCAKCSRPAVEGKSLCTFHREKERAYSHQVTARRKQAGLCLAKGCSAPVSKPSNSYCSEHRDRSRVCNRERLQKIKREVLEHYGHSRCACCGESRLEFLSIDHIHGGGRRHRESLGIGNMCAWLKKQHFPEGFQVLCMNCNFAKGRFGRCPHETEADASRVSVQRPCDDVQPPLMTALGAP